MLITTHLGGFWGSVFSTDMLHSNISAMYGPLQRRTTFSGVLEDNCVGEDGGGECLLLLGNSEFAITVKELLLPSKACELRGGWEVV